MKRAKFEKVVGICGLFILCLVDICGSVEQNKNILVFYAST